MDCLPTEGGFWLEKVMIAKTVIRYKANLTDTKDDLFIDLNVSELDAGKLITIVLVEYRRKWDTGGLRGLPAKPVDPNVVCENGRS